MKQEAINEQYHKQAVAISALVDELALLEEELAPLKDKFKRVEVLKQQLREHMEGAPPDFPVTLKGAIAEVEFTRCRVEQVVTEKRLLVKLLSRGTFDRLATFTIKSLKEFLTEKQIERVVTPYYGSRSVKEIRYYERKIH